MNVVRSLLTIVCYLTIVFCLLISSVKAANDSQWTLWFLTSESGADVPVIKGISRFGMSTESQSEASPFRIYNTFSLEDPTGGLEIQANRYITDWEYHFNNNAFTHRPFMPEELDNRLNIYYGPDPEKSTFVIIPSLSLYGETVETQSQAPLFPQLLTIELNISGLEVPEIVPEKGLTIKIEAKGRYLLEIDLHQMEEERFLELPGNADIKVSYGTSSLQMYPHPIQKKEPDTTNEKPRGRNKIIHKKPGASSKQGDIAVGDMSAGDVGAGDIAVVAYYPAITSAETSTYTSSFWMIKKSDSEQQQASKVNILQRPKGKRNSGKEKARSKSRSKSRETKKSKGESRDSASSFIKKQCNREGIVVEFELYLEKLTAVFDKIYPHKYIITKEVIESYSEITELFEQKKVILDKARQHNKNLGRGVCSEISKELVYGNITRIDILFMMILDTLLSSNNLLIDYYRLSTFDEDDIKSFQVMVKLVATILPDVLESAKNNKKNQMKSVEHGQTLIFSSLCILLNKKKQGLDYQFYKESWDDIKTLLLYVFSHADMKSIAESRQIVTVLAMVLDLGVEFLDFPFMLRLTDVLYEMNEKGIFDDPFDREKLIECFGLVVKLFVKTLRHLDLSEKRLYQLRYRIKAFDLDTKEWDIAVKEYLDAKEKKQQEESDKKLNEAVHLANEFLKEYENDEAELVRLRIKRDHIQSNNSAHETDDDVSELEADDAQEYENKTDQSYADKPKEHWSWKEHFEKATEALSNKKNKEAIRHFEKALLKPMNSLDKARVLSSLADAYYVHKEKNVKKLYDMYRRALDFSDSAQQALSKIDLQYINKKELNQLSESFIRFADELFHGVDQSAHYHNEAIKVIESIDLSSPVNMLMSGDAEALISILIYEGKQLGRTSDMMKSIASIFSKVYAIRKNIFYKRNAVRNKVISKPVSKENVLRKKLEAICVKATMMSDRSKVTSDDDQQEKNVAALIESIVNQTDNFDKIVDKARLLGQENKHYGGTVREFMEEHSSWLTEENEVTRRLKKNLVTSEKMDMALLEIIISNVKTSDNYDYLNQFFKSLYLQIVEIDGNHLCLYNSIALWLQHHLGVVEDRLGRLAAEELKTYADGGTPSNYTNTGMPGAGGLLFSLFAPVAQALAWAFPNQPIYRELANASMVDNLNVEMWGSNDTLKLLILPMLGARAIVFSPDQMGHSDQIYATYYGLDEEVRIVNQDEATQIIRQHPEIILLLHHQNHWQLILPSNVLETAPSNPVQGAMEPTCPDCQYVSEQQCVSPTLSSSAY